MHDWAGYLQRPAADRRRAAGLIAVIAALTALAAILIGPPTAGAEVPGGGEEVLTPAEVQKETWVKELPETVEDGWVKGQTPAAQAAGASPAIVIPESERANNKMPYNGGLVQSGEIHAYVIFWGSRWNKNPSEKEHVLEMFRYINGSPWSGIITQYFDKTGEHPSGKVALTSYTDSSGTEFPENISIESVEAEVKKSIQTQGWPTGLDNTYVVLAAEGGTEAPGFNTTCSRHSFDSEVGVPYEYAAYPAGQSKECIQKGEGVELQPWQQLQSDIAFEFSQTATDPYPYHRFHGKQPSGWIKSDQPETLEEGVDGGREIGEQCFESGNVEAAPNIWLPRIEDDYLLAETGTKCVAQDKEPVRFTLSPGATQFPEPQQATVTATVIPGGWAAKYRFHVTDAAIGYSATVPAEFTAVANTKNGEVVSAKLPSVQGGQTYSETLEGYNVLTEADPPITTSTTVETSTGSFTTPSWPIATSGSASATAARQTSLGGTVNPDGSETLYQFEYGPTTAYGSKTTARAAFGSSPVSVALTATGLSPSTTYHWRITATNSQGTVKGPDKTFTTLAAPAPPKLSSAPTFNGEGKSAYQGVTLIGNRGQWSGASSPYVENSYAGKMLRCNAGGGACSPITPVPREWSYYQPRAQDVGHTIRIEVTATNEGGSTAALSAPSGVVVARGSVLEELAATGEPTQVESNFPYIEWLEPGSTSIGVYEPEHRRQRREQTGTSSLGFISFSESSNYFVNPGLEGFGEKFLEDSPKWVSTPFGGKPNSIYVGEATSRHFQWMSVQGSNNVYARNLDTPEAGWKTISVPGAEGYISDLTRVLEHDNGAESAGFIDTACAHIAGKSCFVATADAETGVVTKTILPLAPRDVAFGEYGRKIWVTVDEPRSAVFGCVPGGSCTEYALPAGSKPGEIIVGWDEPRWESEGQTEESMWFTEEGTNAVGSVSGAGLGEVVHLPAGSIPSGIGTGRSHWHPELWVTERGADKVVSIAP